MGTIISLTLFQNRPQVVTTVYQYLVDAEKKFSANNDNSEIMRINQSAGIRPVSVSPAVFDLIKRAVMYSKKFPNSFNVAIGPLVKLWDIGFSGQRVPSATEIRQKLKAVAITGIELNESQLQVYLKYPGMAIDLGAIAKGYFADQIAFQLKRWGIKDAIIDLGGNVVTLGHNQLAKNSDWQIGIQDPKKTRGEILGKVQLPACSAVTSGIGERNFKVRDKFYHHIISPRTGYPVENDVAQVTIFSPSSIQGEVLATVAFFAGITAGQQLVKQTPNVAAIFVTRAGEIKLTSGLNFKKIA
ncbi:FAD:protein FMN transferase [Loigolactobacillus backii]|uniref:FAD:protein FMN transferase n=1 Tax=Loigolactobacillus backii TaxID=375175 RepID=A0A192H0S5_9LACO|nr:FAD:protein FMN transferase [Loigolactobacillus backii]ANK61955.1 hypothetical protein AYR53_03725 [Loigolactobacillus backii]ANK65428.1 hypothetical protein AYR54_09385 [Loigolactobacillus backii]ANK68851.1 hypothetical protein AYR56_01000 [Loigolactobacillus backii]MDA5386849.1 FAD:protein FMN transferase [Loigolactobacillus backii]MDA5389366.1 FAD:protein FMN transferase [Loigolactobacillus backii]